MNRGVVISPYFTSDGKELHFPGLVGIEPEDLRYYLLYWDKIDFPNNNCIYIGSSPDVKYLEQCGVLQRTMVKASGFAGSVYVDCQIAAAEELNRIQPGEWTIAQNSNKFFTPKNTTGLSPSLEIELYNSLPSPGANVSLDDVLEFKERYSDELFSFRAGMDEIYLDITKSGDIPRAKNAAIHRLEKAISDIDTAASQSWASRLVSGFRVEMNIVNILEKGAAGAGISALAGLPLSVGAALGAAGSVMNIGISSGPNIPNASKDFAYLCHINKELKS